MAEKARKHSRKGRIIYKKHARTDRAAHREGRLRLGLQQAVLLLTGMELADAISQLHEQLHRLPAAAVLAMHAAHGL